ncbi:MAG: response regulator [Thainema sp.]
MKTVLIIESDLSFCKLLSEWIKAEGFNPLVVEDAASGLMAAKQYQPNLVICTDKDSTVDSIKILKSLRNDPATAKIPCFLLTSEVDVDHFFCCFECWSDWIFKAVVKLARSAACFES